MTQVLDRLSFAGSTVQGAAKGLTRVMLFNYWLTYCVLKAKRPKFQRMRAATIGETSADVEVEEVLQEEEPSHEVYSGNGHNGNGHNANGQNGAH